MHDQPLAPRIKRCVRSAAQALGTADPVPYVGPLLDRTFSRRDGDLHYAHNALTPGAVAFEPSFSAQEPRVLRFTIEPLDPEERPGARRDEATREMRRLVGGVFGRSALHWFDAHSEAWRGLFPSPALRYGAWFGSEFDDDGLHASKVYYELQGDDLRAAPGGLVRLAAVAQQALPSLVPAFTTLTCRRERGVQRLTFQHRGPLRVADLGPLFDAVGLGHQLAGVMQVLGVSLGGRFELPQGAVLLGLAGDEADPEVKIEVLLGTIPDLPADFLQLLALSLAERPRELAGLRRWLDAFTPEQVDRPGEFSVLSVRVRRDLPARVSLYLRPVEFDLRHDVAPFGGAGDGLSRPPVLSIA